MPPRDPSPLHQTVLRGLLAALYVFCVMLNRPLNWILSFWVVFAWFNVEVYDGSRWHLWLPFSLLVGMQFFVHFYPFDENNK